jgi:hypothetical protein
VPQGKALYFPVANFGCLTIEAEHTKCNNDSPTNLPAFMRASIEQAIDQIINLEVTVDGHPITDVAGNLITAAVLRSKFRVQSPVYTTIVPEQNLFNAIYPDFVTPADTYFGVDDGFYMMLQPLAPRKRPYRLTLHAQFPNNFTIDITYAITVRP